MQLHCLLQTEVARGGGWGSQPPLNFGEGGLTHIDFEKKNVIAHI